MATTYALEMATRKRTGKGGARSTRREENIPGVLYGKGSEPVAVKTALRPFLRTVGGASVSNMILDLTLDGAESVKARIREIQMDPLTNEVLHVDFNLVSMTERIEIDVPIELEGLPVGVKTFGGLLSQTLRSVTVRVLVTDVPEKITLDVSELGMNDILHVSDIDLPGVEIASDPGLSIAAVSAPKVEEEPTTEDEAVEGEEGAETAEGEEKKEGGDDAKEGEGK